MGTGGRGTGTGAGVRPAARRRGRLRLRRRQNAPRGSAAETVEKIGQTGARRPSATSAASSTTRSVDVLVVATCNHWHAPAAILACAAGKHVYVEKPCSHNPREGELLVEAARKHKRRRADGQPAAQLAEDHRGHRAGPRRRHRPGVPRASRGTTTTARRSARASERPAAEGLDYDLWQGPAPRRPFRDNYPPLQLALVLALGQRRARQQRRPHDRRLPLGPGRRLPDPRHLVRRPLPLRRRPGDARHAHRHLRVRRPQDDHLGRAELQPVPPRRPTARRRLLRRRRHPGDLATAATRSTTSKGKPIKTVKRQRRRRRPPRQLPRRDPQGDASSTARSRKATRAPALPPRQHRPPHRPRRCECDPKNGHILDDTERNALWTREYEKGWEPKV